ncbi:exonuclease domain-containing protein [Inquilinus sp. CAU 1745]|uniref:3'-5' exonuclease n=1 Tax=Inquilinus sp. CAU 1745 TaxID=3140369 RepID=UPI00325C1DFC
MWGWLKGLFGDRSEYQTRRIDPVISRRTTATHDHVTRETAEPPSAEQPIAEIISRSLVESETIVPGTNQAEGITAKTMPPVGEEKPEPVGPVPLSPSSASPPAPIELVEPTSPEANRYRPPASTPRFMIREVVVDVETTGLTKEDRIVSLGAIELLDHAPSGAMLHLVFNPGIKSHWAARRAHGLADRYLSFQPPFEDHGREIREFIGTARVVGHNIAFDIEMLNREFIRCGLPTLLLANSFCTMGEFRSRYPGQRSGLDAALAMFGVGRQMEKHNALEDAVLATALCLLLRKGRATVEVLVGPPSNEVQPHRRKWKPNSTAEPTTSRKDGNSPTIIPDIQGIGDVVNAVTILKRERRYQEALALLLPTLDAMEKLENCALGVAPWYYEQCAIIYRKMGNDYAELEVLQRYAGQPKALGAGPAKLQERLEKVQRRIRGRVRA